MLFLAAGEALSAETMTVQPMGGFDHQGSEGLFVPEDAHIKNVN